MALFTSYAPPGVYTKEVFTSNTATAVGTARIPVIIGEGQQFFQTNNFELFRGSSAVQDDQSVNENISDQVSSLTQNFQTTFYPVTNGAGKGVVTNDPSKVQVQAIYPSGDAVPVTVVSLNGATGAFVTQEIIPAGTDLTITYSFKRGDTLVTLEDDSAQVPQYAKLWVDNTGALQASATVPNPTVLALSLTNPGEAGNLVTVQFVDGGSGQGVPDAQAVFTSGDEVAINIRKPGDVIRTVQNLATLISAGIPTLDGGFITASASASTQTLSVGGGSPPVDGAVAYSGGVGGGSNTLFQVRNYPITDGSNGGVVTNDPALVTAQVNGVNAAVAAVNGQLGLVTLAKPVAFGSTLTFTYYYNTWQNTFDLLPSANVASILEVGLGPNSDDFRQGVDYTLGTALDIRGNVVANTVNWGDNVSEAVGKSAAGELANFTPSEVLATLAQDRVYLRPASGAVNGRNTVFTLQDTPVDGHGKITNDPSQIKVYVGSDPLTAFENGAVAVAQLNGLAQTVTLYNAPVLASGEPVGVFASYSRNTLASHQYTVSVVTPDFVGNGTYQVQDELGRVAPLVQGGTNAVAAGGFVVTGVLYPNTVSFASPYQTGDAQAAAGAAVNETVTLTFNHDGDSSGIPGVQATRTFTFSSTGQITFTASNPGDSGNNVRIALDASSFNAVPVVVSGDLVTIYANWAGTLLTMTQIAALFPSAETASGGQIIASGAANGTAVGVTAATKLLNGADGVFTPITHSYTVSSSLGAGRGSGSGAGSIGYLNQTYIDSVTGFRVTVVRTDDHVAYGIPTIPASYEYAPGDTLQYVVKADASGAKAATRACGTPGTAPAYSNNAIAIPGLNMEVVTNYNSTAGDTVIVSTFKGSGDGPNIGAYYFVTFTTNKAASDYAIKLYTKPSDAYAVYGAPNTINRASLGIQLMSLNGVQTFGVIQVPVVPGTNFASSTDYIAALAQLKQNLPGLNRKADVVVPLSNDPTVHQALSQQLTTLATPRYKGEGIGFVGYSQFTTPAQASANANSLLSQRMIAIGNAAAGILITNLTTGTSFEYLVDGPFMAAALAGLNCNPSNDVATTLTFQNLVGFSRLLVTYDDPTMDLMAANGLTLLLNNNGSLLVRHYKTTNPSDTLVSEPTSTTIADYVAQSFRSNLAYFIGRKLVDSLVTDISVVCNSLLRGLVDAQIITGYEALVVEQDPQDPTQVDVTVTFKPIFSLLYVSVTFTVQTSL